MLRVVLCMLLFALPASAQILELAAGRSTLLNGTGAEVIAFFPQSTLSASAGFANGHFVAGASDTFLFHGLEITAGDKNFGYSFDGAGLGVSTRGLFIQRKSRRTLFAVFAGSSGLGYTTSFMNTEKSEHLGAGFFLQRDFENGLLLSSLGLIDGGRHTAVQGLSYHARLFRVAGRGGVLQNQKYFTGEGDFQPLQSLSFSATHSDYFLSDRLTTNSLSAFASLGLVTLQGSVLDGHYQGLETKGASAGASVRIGTVTVRSNVYESNHRTLLVHVVQERYRHWTLAAIVNQAQGQVSYAFGGGYQGNVVSVNLDHSVLFFPAAGKGFEQTTSVQVSWRIHDTAINFQTYMDPMMRVQYTAYASSYVQGPLAGLEVNGHSHSTGGKFLISGTVVDGHGQAVEGAAIQVQKVGVVYTDSAGKFFARVKHDKPLALTVLVREFATPGRWAVASCPAEAVPGTDVLITLKRGIMP